MNKCFVSVVLPVFNAERTVSEALTSVLGQTYADFEAIIIDDGSTDSSPELLAAQANCDERISIIRTANRGVAAALNTGLAAARGDLIARMDADDICEPQRFERQVAHLSQHESCVAVGCGVIEIDGSGLPRPKQPRVASNARLSDRCRNFRRFPPSPPTLAHPTAMIRSEAINAVGGYRPHLRWAEDRDLWWRLSQRGEIHCLPERLLRYRRHAASITQKNRERIVADTLLSDLSAVARHFGLNDSTLLERYKCKGIPEAAIQQYVQLIGGHYPAAQLASFRAITRGYPSLAGHRDRSSTIRYALLQILRNPFSWTGYRLVSAARSLR